MRKTFLLLFMLVVSATMTARSMRSLWISMPPSVIPYLDKSKRLEMLDLIDIKAIAEVSNALGEPCRIDTLTGSFLSVQLSDVSSLQMKLLPTSERDTILCLVQSYAAPAVDSRISFYSLDWKELPVPQPDLSLLIVRPDTMTAEEFTACKKFLDPLLVSFSLSAERNELTVTLSPTLLSKEERDRIEPIIMQRKYKWNGLTFN